MESNSGMMAVVKGTRDAGLSVAIVDGEKTYGLPPNTFTQATPNQHPKTTPYVNFLPPVYNPYECQRRAKVPHYEEVHNMTNSNNNIPHLNNMSQMNNMTHMNNMSHMAHFANMGAPMPMPMPMPMPVSPQANMPCVPKESRSIAVSTGLNDCYVSTQSCDTGCQAIDGRYTSVYQTTLCHQQPTSPPIQVTEFPPQRPGPPEKGCFQSHFVVGGPGSGDTGYSPPRYNNSFRGGMTWTDRGSVCSPRVSRASNCDPFTSSLRKYPKVSPDRSSEIVERLITYTQAKNYGKGLSNRQNSARNSDQMGRRYISTKNKYTEESPTRDVTKKIELENFRKAQLKNFDVRYVRDMSRIVRDNIKATSPSTQFQQPMYPQKSREFHPNPGDRTRTVYTNGEEIRSPNMVSSEIQAAAKMVCKEVSTCPRARAPKRIVTDLKLSSTPHTGSVSYSSLGTPQNIRICSPVFVQSFKSSTQVQFHNELSEIQRSLSEASVVPLKKDVRKQEIVDEKFVANELKNWRRKHDQSKTAAQYDDKKKLTDIALRNKHSDINAFYATLSSCSACNDNIAIRQVIRNWLYDVPLKKFDFLGRLVRKEQILSYIICRLKIIPTEVQSDIKKFRAEVLDIVDGVPFQTENCNRLNYLSKLTEDLLNRLLQVKVKNVTECRHIKPKSMKYYNRNTFIVNHVHTIPNGNVNEVNTVRNNVKAYRVATTETTPGPALPTAKTMVNVKASRRAACFGTVRPSGNEIQEFIRAELTNSVKKIELNIDMSKVLEIETDVVYILSDNLDNLYKGKDDDAISEITWLLREVGGLLRQQAAIYAENLMEKFKDQFLRTLKNPAVDRVCATSYIQVAEKQCDAVTSRNNVLVYSSFTQSVSTSTESRHGSNDNVKKEEINLYKRELEQVIENWLNSFSNVIPQICNKQFRQAVIIDLVEDIMYRKRYLEFSPRIKVAEKTELEHLRYQIFKWVNKLAGHNSMVTLVKVPELMKAIQSIQVSNINESPINQIPDPKREIQFTQTTPTTAENKTHNPSLHRPISAINLSKNIPIYITQTSSVFDQSKINSILQSEQNSESINFSNSQSNSVNDSESKKSEGVGSAVVDGTTTVTDTTSQEGEVNAATSTNKADLPPPASTEPVNLVQQEYDKLHDYIREWVEIVPIITEPGESISEEMMKKARLGLFHGVSNIVQRVMQLPRVCHDEFHLQDFFDDNLEDLLDAVPPAPEFLDQKHALKHKLIEKVVFHFKAMQFTVPRQRYVEKLAKDLGKYVPKSKTQVANIDPILLSEQIKMLYIVEDFILTLAHREDDIIKYNAYRMRLIQHIREFVEGLKKTHKTDYLRDINSDLYMTEIIKSLEQVPKPSDETIREQADEILLKIEVDQWFNNLPIAENNDMQEQYKRMKMRDELSKKLFEWDRKNLKNHSGSFDESAEERNLKHEVSRALGKLPLLKDESLKMNDMIDDLTSKVKNRLRYERMRNENISLKMQSRRPERAAAPQYRPQVHQLNDSQSQYGPYYVPGGLPQRPGPTSRPDCSMPRRSGLPGRRVVFQQPPMPTIPQRNVVLNESIPIGYILDRYEAYHPPYATPNASIQFGPTRSRLIQNPELFIHHDLPFSSSMNEQRFQRSLNLGNLSDSHCLQNLCEQFRPVQNMEQGVAENCRGETCTPQQNVNKNDNSEKSSEWKSLESTSLKPEIWNRSPGQPLSSPSPDPPPKDPPTPNSFVPAEKVQLPTRDTVWIQPYLDDYEAAHPDPPSGPLTYGFQPAENTVLYPPNYTLFSAERPVSSSAYHLDSMLDDSISVCQPYYATPGIGLTEPSRYYAISQEEGAIGQGLVPGQIQNMSGPYGLRQIRDPRSQTHVGIGQGLVPGPTHDFNRPHGIRYVSDPLNPGQSGMYQRLVPAPTHEMIGPSGMMQPLLPNNAQMGTSQRRFSAPAHEMSRPYGVRNVSGLVSQAPMEMSQKLFTSPAQNLGRPGAKSHTTGADSIGAVQFEIPAQTKAVEYKSGRCGLGKCQVPIERTSGTSPEQRFRKLWEEKASSDEVYQTLPSATVTDESQPRVEGASPLNALISLGEKGPEQTKSPTEQISSSSDRHQSARGRVFGFPGELIAETSNVSRSVGAGIGAHPSVVTEPPINRGDRPQKITYKDQGVQYIPHDVDQRRAADPEGAEGEVFGDHYCYCGRNVNRPPGCARQVNSCIRLPITLESHDNSFCCPYYFGCGGNERRCNPCDYHEYN